ncbi:MAG: cation:proton antiporter [Desulfobulbaceae bacterium]|jgi:Kef-type K+ transport system membrane component KefB/nucleotide-binding universal stress UspA family protein|nr:cation:proton antiporter [Desulfobulbaceae bacterium]
MNEVTLGIAILLSVGLLAAKAAQLLRLPSVTGFILAGVLLGPSFSGVITMESVGRQLEHFTEIALMLIAFGIGEHIELRRLGGLARHVGYVSVVQALGSFVFVCGGTYLTVLLFSGPESVPGNPMVPALLLGAIAVATAPATLLHVVRETGARGSLTTTLMAVVAMVDALAIMFFGTAMSVSHQLIGQGGESLMQAVAGSGGEIILSLAIGLSTGTVIDYVLNRLHNRGEMLTAGLALLLLCGETTRLLDLSPLLAGMAAGFAIINRAERDVRLFRIINDFEPPIYVLFFTLAGAHLEVGALKIGGWIGIVYFIARLAGKYFGSWLGALLSGASPVVRNYLGLALFPQAGVAIGLVILINSDPALTPWAVVITPVVLAGVVFSELFGPYFTRYAIEKAGEGMQSRKTPECGDLGPFACKIWLRSPEGISLHPWDGGRLLPAAVPDGVVAFGVHHFATGRGLARIATFLAHHYHALPMSVRVLDPARMDDFRHSDYETLFLPEADEVASLGYPLKKEFVFDNPVSGVLAALEQENIHALLLAYPAGKNPRAFHGTLEKVAARISCPLIAVRFVGGFKTDRILVPFLSPTELGELQPILEAMAMTVQPSITFFHLLHFDSSREEVQACDRELQDWLADNFFDIQTRHMVEAAESRLEMILQEAKYHDLVIMTGAKRYGLERLLLGSLSNSVVLNCGKPVMVVYSPDGRSGTPGE